MTDSKPAEKHPQSEPYQIIISDMTCQHCVTRVEKVINAMDGVQEGHVNLVEKLALVSGGEPEKVVAAIIDQGYDAKLLLQEIPDNTYRVKVNQLPLPDNKTVNPSDILALLSEQSDISEAILQSENLDNGQQTVFIITTKKHPADLVLLLQQHGYSANLFEQTIDPQIQQLQEANREIKQSWQRAAMAGFVGISLMISMQAGWLPPVTQGSTFYGLVSGQIFWFIIALCCLFTMWFSGRNYYITAIKQAKHQSANMDTLVALGTASAWLSSVIIIFEPDFIPGGGHLYLDAAVFILAFLQMGHALEVKAKRTTAKAIAGLIELAPKTAQIIRDYNEQTIEIEVPVSLLQINDRVKVRPGERIPIDGRLIAGSSSVDESMLTGEAVAISKKPGSRVTGGSINQSGSFIFEVEKLAQDTTLSHIIDMVRQAQISKPQIGRMVDKVAGVFVPIVISIAVISFIAWFVFGPEPQLAYALTTGIAVLVIACPCALGLATPIAIMVGTGKAAQYNILIKNSDALQTASTLTHLVVDKTGTLTQGKPILSRIVNYGLDEQSILQLAASLEQHSEHPLAQTIINAAIDKQIDYLTVSDFRAIQGRGVTGFINDKKVMLGNRALMNENKINISEQDATNGTNIWLVNDNQLIAMLVLEDPIRDDTPQAIEALQSQGIEIVMCTGDNINTANSVARQLNISQIHAELLPQDKLKIISGLQSQGFIVGMVGDGINDAPALARANTGFAIGSGTDVAIENADITLAGNSLKNVSTAIAISSATILNIKQNLFGAFIYNVIGIPLAAGLFYPMTGWLLAPAFASAAMAMSSVTVVVNANRLRFFKRT